MNSDLRSADGCRVRLPCRAGLWLAVGTAISALAAGCGSGGGGKTTVAVDSAAETVQAQTQLNALVAGATPNTGASGGSDILSGIDASSLASVRSMFASAYAAKPTNTAASFGLGATDLAVSAQAVVAASNGALGKAQPAHRAEATKAASAILAALVRPAVLWNLNSVQGVITPQSLAAVATLPLARTRQTEIPASAPSLDAALNNLLTALNRDIPLITAAADDPGFTFPLSGLGDKTVTTTIDQADARAFEAALYGARAAVDAALAYDLDPGTFPFDEPIPAPHPATFADVAITPATYLPPAPFGQLASNGKALLASAKSDLLTATTVVQSDVTLLQGRTGTATHLIPTTALTSADYSTLQLGLIAAQYALGHSFTTGGVTYNLNSWFANPPQSLTALEPTYHLRTTDSATAGYAATAADYPDKTFGGLISGLPDSAYTPSVAFDGTYSDLATEGLATPLKAAVPDSF